MNTIAKCLAWLFGCQVCGGKLRNGVCSQCGSGLLDQAKHGCSQMTFLFFDQTESGKAGFECPNCHNINSITDPKCEVCEQKLGIWLFLTRGIRWPWRLESHEEALSWSKRYCLAMVALLAASLTVGPFLLLQTGKFENLIGAFVVTGVLLGLVIALTYWLVPEVINLGFISGPRLFRLGNFCLLVSVLVVSFGFIQVYPLPGAALLVVMGLLWIGTLVFFRLIFPWALDYAWLSNALRGNRPRRVNPMREQGPSVDQDS